MTEPTKVAAKIFADLDAAGGNKGVEYRPLSATETSTERVKNQPLESMAYFKVNFGQGAVMVDRKQFQAFLQRNNLYALQQLPPETAIEELLNIQMLRYPAWLTLNARSGQKPWKANVFAFIHDHLDEIESIKKNRNNSLYPFSFLLALLDVKNITMSHEAKRKAVSKDLDTLVHTKEAKESLGLQDPAIRYKIIHDAYTY